MPDLRYEILRTVSSSARLADAATKLVEISVRHAGASAGACLRAAPASHFFLVVATHGRLLRGSHWSSAMVRLRPEVVDVEEISEIAEGLLFEGTACFANVWREKSFLIRLEWDDLLAVDWARVKELREGCRDLAGVLERFEQLDSQMTELQRMKPSAAAEPRLERLLPTVARLAVGRTGSSWARVTAEGEEAVVGEPARGIEAPIEVAGERIGVLSAGGEAEPLIALAREVRPFLWKAVLHRRSKLLMVGLPREVLESAERFGASHAPVMLSGETGTGKEALARFIHVTGERRKGPFVTVNAAEIVETLAESQLFGHRKGSFTGATADAPGAFELADGGTLFLDEIHQLQTNVQAKILRAIEYGEIRPLGAREPRRVDVRIVAATNRDLAEEVRAGRFLQDLSLRMNVFEIRLPALRQNREAIPRIARAIVEELTGKMPEITPRALKQLAKAEFPGNIRELRNVLQNAIVNARDGPIDIDALPVKVLGVSAERESELSFDKARALFERDYLMRLVRHAKGNMTAAAELSGLDRSHLYRLLKKHGLTPSDIVGD